MTGLHWKSERREGGHPPYIEGTGNASERHERGKILGTILHQDRPLFLSPAFRERISDGFGNAFASAELRLFLKTTCV